MFSGLSRPKKILSNQFLSNGFLVHKLKINAKLQEKTLARWDMSIHHVPTVSCVSLGSPNFVFNILIRYHGRFKATKKSSLRISSNYQNQLTRRPLSKFDWYKISSRRPSIRGVPKKNYIILNLYKLTLHHAIGKMFS